MPQNTLVSFNIPNDLTHERWRQVICKSAIKARYGTVAGYARNLGISRQAIHMAIQGSNRSRRIEGLLSELTGYPVSVLFPDRAA